MKKNSLLFEAKIHVDDIRVSFRICHGQAAIGAISNDLV
jgi:hypothetical protein